MKLVKLHAIYLKSSYEVRVERYNLESEQIYLKLRKEQIMVLFILSYFCLKRLVCLF